MLFLNDTIKDLKTILFKKDEIPLSLETQDGESDSTPAPIEPTLAWDAFKTTCVGDWRAIEDEDNGLTNKYQKYIYYFTHWPFFKEVYEIRYGDDECSEEGLKKESNEKEKKALRTGKKIRRVFDWINFLLFPVSLVWYVFYFPFVLCTEFLLRGLENFLLRKYRESESRLYGTFFGIVKVGRLLLCTLTSPIQSLKNAWNLDRERYRGIRIVLIVSSGLLSSVGVAVVFALTSLACLKIFGTSVATHIVPNISRYNIQLRILIETAINGVKTAIPQFFEHGPRIVTRCVNWMSDRREILAAVRESRIYYEGERACRFIDRGVRGVFTRSDRESRIPVWGVFSFFRRVAGVGESVSGCARSIEQRVSGSYASIRRTLGLGRPSTGCDEKDRLLSGQTEAGEALVVGGAEDLHHRRPRADSVPT